MDPLNRNLLATAAPSGGANVADVFSTDLWFGNNGRQVISNGLNLSGDGGMVWIKNRQSGYDHQLYDTNMGATYYVLPNDYNGKQQNDTGLDQFKADGYEVGSSAIVNQAGNNIVGWSFKNTPGFFDCLQYTGNGGNNHVINHNLGVEPGVIMIKEISSGGTKLYDWVVYSKDVGTGKWAKLNKTDIFQASNPLPFLSTPTGSSFELSSLGTVNASSRTFNAYLFAADTPNLIKCGTYMGNGSTRNDITTGFETGWVMVKPVVGGSWGMWDTVRGMGTSNIKRLLSDSAAIENSSSTGMTSTPTGFYANNYYNINDYEYMYIAIAAPQ